MNVLNELSHYTIVALTLSILLLIIGLFSNLAEYKPKNGKLFFIKKNTVLYICAFFTPVFGIIALCFQSYETAEKNYTDRQRNQELDSIREYNFKTTMDSFSLVLYQQKTDIEQQNDILRKQRLLLENQLVELQHLVSVTTQVEEIRYPISKMVMQMEFTFQDNLFGIDALTNSIKSHLTEFPMDSESNLGFTFKNGSSGLEITIPFNSKLFPHDFFRDYHITAEIYLPTDIKKLNFNEDSISDPRNALKYSGFRFSPSKLVNRIGVTLNDENTGKNNFLVYQPEKKQYTYTIQYELLESFRNEKIKSFKKLENCILLVTNNIIGLFPKFGFQLQKVNLYNSALNQSFIMNDYEINSAFIKNPVPIPQGFPRITTVAYIGIIK